jgi:hypothetical protein
MWIRRKKMILKMKMYRSKNTNTITSLYAQLTPQQRFFVSAHIREGLSLRDAYRAAYPARRARLARTEIRNASRLAAQPHIRKAMEQEAGRLASERIAANPYAIREEALSALREIRHGRRDPDEARAIGLELREANRAVRQLEQAPRKQAWRVFVRAMNDIDQAKRARVQAIPPQERTREIFAALRPEAVPAPSAVDTKPEPAVPSHDSHRAELRGFVGMHQKERRTALLRREPVVWADPNVPPGPAGHWEERRVPGRFGSGSLRRIWVPNPPEEKAHHA